MAASRTHAVKTGSPALWPCAASAHTDDHFIVSPSSRRLGWSASRTASGPPTRSIAATRRACARAERLGDVAGAVAGCGAGAGAGAASSAGAAASAGASAKAPPRRGPARGRARPPRPPPAPACAARSAWRRTCAGAAQPRSAADGDGAARPARRATGPAASRRRPRRPALPRAALPRAAFPRQPASPRAAFPRQPASPRAASLRSRPAASQGRAGRPRAASLRPRPAAPQGRAGRPRAGPRSGVKPAEQQMVELANIHRSVRLYTDEPGSMTTRAIDPTFLALPLDRLADVALEIAKRSGATYADFRSSASAATSSLPVIASCKRLSRARPSASACAWSPKGRGDLRRGSTSPPTRFQRSRAAPSKSRNHLLRSIPSPSRSPTSPCIATRMSRATRSIRLPLPKIKKSISCSRSTIARSHRS